MSNHVEQASQLLAETNSLFGLLRGYRDRSARLIDDYARRIREIRKTLRETLVLMERDDYSPNIINFLIQSTRRQIEELKGGLRRSLGELNIITTYKDFRVNPDLVYNSLYLYLRRFAESKNLLRWKEGNTRKFMGKLATLKDPNGKLLMKRGLYRLKFTFYIFDIQGIKQAGEITRENVPIYYIPYEVLSGLRIRKYVPNRIEVYASTHYYLHSNRELDSIINGVDGSKAFHSWDVELIMAPTNGINTEETNMAVNMNCALDHITKALMNANMYRRLCYGCKDDKVYYQKVYNHLYDRFLVDKQLVINPERIIKWAKEEPRVKLAIVGPFMEKLYYKPACSSDKHKRAVIAFQQKDRHCYPLEKKHVDRITYGKTYVGDDMRLHCTDNNYEIREYAWFDNMDSKDYYVFALDILDSYILQFGYPKNMMKTGNYRSFLNDKGKTIVIDPTVLERQDVFDNIRNTYPNNIAFMKFKCETYTTMAKQMVKMIAGYALKESCMHPTIRNMYDTFFCRATIQCEINNIKGRLSKVDIRRCHTNIMLDFVHGIPVYTLIDKLVRYNGGDILCGDYLLRKFTDIHGVIHHDGFYSSYFVSYFKSRGLTDDKILYRYVPSGVMDSKVLHKSIRAMQNVGGKKLINCLSGWFGSRFIKKKISTLISDPGTLQHMLFDLKNTETIDWDIIQGKIYVYKTLHTRKFKDYMPIYNAIISSVHVKICELIEHVGKPVIEIYCDSVVFDGFTEINHDKYRYEPVTLHRMNVKGRKLKRWKFDSYEVVNEEKSKVYKPPERMWKSSITIGDPGVGKTHNLCTLYHAYKGHKIIICSKMHSALLNITHMFKSMFGYSPVVRTMDSLMVTGLRGIKVLLIDEYSMLEMSMIQELVKYKLEHSLTLHMFGDSNQLGCIDRLFGKLRNYRWENTNIMKWLVDYRYNLIYKSDSRYDPMYHDLLMKFKHEGVLGEEWNEKTLMECKKNIALTNKMVDTINARMGSMVVNSNVLCVETCVTKKVYNGQIYTIKGIKEGLILINGKWVDRKLFKLPFAFTVNKSQGRTFRENYCIHEMGKFFTRNQVLVALSRAVGMDNVWFDYSKVKGKKFYWASDRWECLELENVTGNHETKIYKVGNTYNTTKRGKYYGSGYCLGDKATIKLSELNRGKSLRDRVKIATRGGKKIVYLSIRINGKQKKKQVTVRDNVEEAINCLLNSFQQ